MQSGALEEAKSSISWYGYACDGAQEVQEVYQLVCGMHEHAIEHNRAQAGHLFEHAIQHAIQHSRYVV